MARPAAIFRFRLPLFLGLLSFALCLLQLTSKSFDLMTHDIEGGRLFYIDFIAKTFTLPRPDLCDQCFHPPLYHIMAAMAYLLAKAAGIQQAMYGANALSLMFYGVYLYYAGRLICQELTGKPAQIAALAVTFFWPLGFNMARSISNDVALVAACVAGFYYLLRWLHAMAPRDMVLAMVWLVLGMHFKTSAALLGLCIIGAIFYKGVGASWKSVPEKRRPAMLVFAAFAGLIALLPIGRVAYFYAIDDQPAQEMRVLSRMWAQGSQFLGNEPGHYLTFDLASYVTDAYYHVYSDNGGRRYFWNALLKTSLFDEFEWGYNALALILAELLLGMVVYVIASGIAAYRAGKTSGWGFCSAAIALHVAALIAYRMYSPYACTQEYRYIFAITPLFAVLLGKAIDCNGLIARHIGLGLASGFATCSIVFILLFNLT